jgi:hypothetical protein
VIELEAVDELDPLLCSGDIVSFSETLIVELEICETADIDQDIAFLEESFVSTYNALVMEYCDPDFRFLETALVVEQGAPTPAGNLPVEFEVTGKCNGCDPDKASIYDFPTVVTASSRMLMATRTAPPRMLEELNSTCYCKANALANRAPSETEFINAYRTRVSSLEVLSCVESVGACQFGSTFESTLLLSFGNDTDVEALNEQIEEAVLSALTILYETTADSCNPEFRLFQSAKARLGENVQDDQDGGRLLFDGPWLRQMQATNVSNPTVEGEPTMSPTPLFGTGLVDLILAVSGICNGCSNSLLLSNQVDNRRALQSLQDDEPSSYCFCPLNSTVKEQPSIVDFEISLQSRFDQENITIDVKQVLDISTAAPTGDEECNPLLPVVDFETIVTVEVVVCEDFSTLDEEQKTAIAQAFVSSYNSLVASYRYCDPFSRYVTEADVVRVGSLRNGGNNLPIELVVGGKCRGGCNPDGFGLYEVPSLLSSPNRLLWNNEALNKDDTGHRDLQGDFDTCYCDARAVAQRAPFEAEFIEVYQPAVSNLTLDCIGSVGECQFGTTFKTEIVVAFDDDGTIIFEVITTEIGEAFMAAVNEVYASDGTTCDREFRIVEDVTANVWNCDNLSEPPVNDGRQLYHLRTGRNLQQNGTGLGNSTTGPTSAPTPVFGTGVTFVLLSVSGICNGCPNEIFLSNQVDGGRQLQSSLVLDPFRGFQDDAGDASSNCYCPIAAVIVSTQLKLEDVVEPFQNLK